MKTSIVKFFAGSGIRLAVLSLLFLGLTGICMAQASAASPAIPAATHAKPAPAAPAQPRPAGTAARGAGGKHEGITVHGWWVIEVKDPDGRVAQHREFENSLVTTGGNAGGPLLVLLLSGSAAVVGAQINFGVAGSAQVCALPSTPNTGACEPTTSVLLPMGTSVSGLNAPKTLTLSGTLPPESGSVCSNNVVCQSGDIDWVSTSFNLATVTGNTISSGSTEYDLTYATDYSTPPAFSEVPVLAGQTVSVTVTISFQ